MLDESNISIIIWCFKYTPLVKSLVSKGLKVLGVTLQGGMNKFLASGGDSPHAPSRENPMYIWYIYTEFPLHVGCGDSPPLAKILFIPHSPPQQKSVQPNKKIKTSFLVVLIPKFEYIYIYIYIIHIHIQKNFAIGFSCLIRPNIVNIRVSIPRQKHPRSFLTSPPLKSTNCTSPPFSAIPPIYWIFKNTPPLRSFNEPPKY